MKEIRLLLLMIFVLLLSTAITSSQEKTIEWTKDNPTTLIGTSSIDFRISGFFLGMTHEQAWKILEKSETYIGEADEFNPERIYVYDRNTNGNKGDCLLYLVWQPNENKLGHISIFEDFEGYLSENFKWLLTKAVINNTSDFKKAFIGHENRSEITLDVPQNNGRAKQISYFYDHIGLQIAHTTYPGKEFISVSIVKPAS